MIIDKELELSDAQAFTTVAEHVSTNVIDQGAEGDAIGRELWFRCKVATAFTSGGSATLVVLLETDGDSAFGSAKQLWISSTIAVATLVKGYNIARIKLPIGTERYIRATYTVAVAAMTAGALDCDLVPALQTNNE